MSAAEQHIIGISLLWPDAVDDIALAAEDFTEMAHATIWRTVRSMIDAGSHVDPLTVAERLEKDGRLDDVGGLQYLTELADAVYSPGGAKTHAAAIRDAAIRRALMSTLNGIAQSINEAPSISDVLAEAQARIMAIGERAESREPVKVSTVAVSRISVLDEIFSGNDNGLSTGLTDVDEMLGKVRPGDMIVVAGRPGMGKSAFAMQIAESMANESNPGLFFSLEMSAGQLVDRIMSAAGRVNLKKFRTANFDDQDWHGLTSAMGQVKDMPIFIDDHSNTLSQIMSVMRSFKRRNGLGVVVIDYIGLVQSEGDTRDQEVAKVTRALKLAAKQLGCPIIALSQLNRKLEDRADKRPMQSDLRDSGSIEQDADAILMLYRDEYYNPDSAYKGVCEVIVRKNRHGETGTVPTVFRADLVRFENYSGHYDTTPEKPYRRSRKDI